MTAEEEKEILIPVVEVTREIDDIKEREENIGTNKDETPREIEVNTIESS